MKTLVHVCATLVAASTLLGAAACVISPDGQIVGFGFAPPVVYAHGVPPAVVTVQTPPPAPVYEVAPQPVYGQVWVTGEQYWTGSAYAWRPGRYIPARAGYSYYPGAWTTRAGGYSYVPGFYRPANLPPPRYNAPVYRGGAARVQIYRR